MCIVHRNITESKSIELNYLYGKVNVVLCFDAGESIHRKERPVLRFMKIMPYLMENIMNLMNPLRVKLYVFTIMLKEISQRQIL